MMHSGGALVSRPIIALLALIAACPSVLAQTRPPNVLIIVGDDHSYDVLGAYGSKLAHTPSLDRLAAQGVRFDRAYCNTPICSPSRQSFLCGRYPQTVGVTLLSHALDDSAYTLAHRLREAGYRTGAFGKMHFNSNRSHGFEVFKPESAYHAWDRSHPHRPLPEGLQILPPVFRPFQDPARVWLNGINVPFGRYDDDMPGTWYARQAIDFIKDNKDRPFFAQIGFNEPHSPFWFPVDFKDRFRPADMTVPKPGPEDAGQIPKVFADLTYADKQGIIASYYTSAAFLDSNVGRVLAAIDSLGLADNTLVIYLGDNGYHLGQHGRFEKHCFFDRAVRVPLVMRLPGRIKPGSTAALVEFVDLVPTVLDYLGLPADPKTPPPRDLHGHSLRPIVEARRDKVRDAVFSEYRHTEEAMVRTDRYKLIYRTIRALTDWYEPVQPPTGRGVRLYDEINDPEEMHDIAADPANAGVVSDLLDRLAAFYHRFPPRGETPPQNLSREDFLDWAIAQRNPLTAPAK